MCKKFYRDSGNNANPKCWKRTEEAHTHGLRELMNAQAKCNEREQETEMEHGEKLEEDKVKFEHWDDTDSQADGGSMMGLLDFKGTPHWNDDSDSDCISSKEEEEEEEEDSGPSLSNDGEEIRTMKRKRTS